MQRQNNSSDNAKHLTICQQHFILRLALDKSSSQTPKQLKLKLHLGLYPSRRGCSRGANPMWKPIISFVTCLKPPAYPLHIPAEKGTEDRPLNWSMINRAADARISFPFVHWCTFHVWFRNYSERKIDLYGIFGYTILDSKSVNSCPSVQIRLLSPDLEATNVGINLDY